MNNAIDHLISEFEAGKLSRRDLAKGIAAMTAAAAAGTWLSGKNIAQAGTGDLTDWQQALLTGVANVHFRIPPGTRKPVMDGGEPFSSEEHQDWLFKTPANSNDPDCLKSPLRSKIRNAVKAVPKKDGTPWNADPDTGGAGSILGVLNFMDECRGTDDDNLNSILYELICLKINHAEEHGREDGMLDMAGVIYNGTEDANCRAEIVRLGSEHFFNESGHEDEFRELIEDRPYAHESHDW